MMKIKVALMTGMAVLSAVSLAFAGGAAVQQQRQATPPPEVREQIRERLRFEREQRQQAEQILRQRQRQSQQQRQAPEEETSKKETETPPYVPPNNVLVSGSPARRPPSSAAQTDVSPDSAALEDDLSQLFGRLDRSSEDWRRLSDMRVKVMVVQRYIDLYAKYGVSIRQPPLRYVVLIDSVAAQNPGLIQRPFDEVLRIMAILEYDYDDGTDKDALARTILNQEGVMRNKARLGLQ